MAAKDYELRVSNDGKVWICSRYSENSNELPIDHSEVNPIDFMAKVSAWANSIIPKEDGMDIVRFKIDGNPIVQIQLFRENLPKS
jgi:hypothetical protein